jgi:hypothetical protein
MTGGVRTITPPGLWVTLGDLVFAGFEQQDACFGFFACGW